MKRTGTNSVLLKIWGFSGLASSLASVQFPAVDTVAFVNPQISEARFVSCDAMAKFQQIGNDENIIDYQD
jgi:hypothetical protein